MNFSQVFSHHATRAHRVSLFTSEFEHRDSSGLGDNDEESVQDDVSDDNFMLDDDNDCGYGNNDDEDNSEATLIPDRHPPHDVCDTLTKIQKGLNNVTEKDVRRTIDEDEEKKKPKDKVAMMYNILKAMDEQKQMNEKEKTKRHLERNRARAAIDLVGVMLEESDDSDDDDESTERDDVIQDLGEEESVDEKWYSDKTNEGKLIHSLDDSGAPVVAMLISAGGSADSFSMKDQTDMIWGVNTTNLLQVVSLRMRSCQV